MNNEDYGRLYNQAWNELQKENPKPVILVTGATGVGKSTLINLVIGRQVATVGTGQPETQNMDRFDNDQLIIYDSKGYETGEDAQKEFFREISNFLEDKKKSPLTAINIIWHCISAPAARVVDVDAMLLNDFKKQHIPVAVVLTQVDSSDSDQIDDLTKEIQNISSTTSIFWSTEDTDLEKELPKDKNLDKLFEWSLNHMDVTRRAAFRAACNRDLSGKRSKGHAAALAAATTAFGIGFIPMPAADAPALITAQSGMLATISYIWGMNFMALFSAAGGFPMLMTQLGRTVAGNLIKLFPGVGSLLGGFINASVGASLTYGLGMAVNEICYQSCLAEFEGRPSPLVELFSKDNFMDLVEKYIKEYRKEKPSKE